VAVEFLTQSDVPLLEVAARVGFQKSSPSTAPGLTPGTYRQAHNEPAEDDVLV